MISHILLMRERLESMAGAWRSGVHARVLHYDSSLSESDRTQASDLVTGNTSTGSESGVDLLKAPQRWELTWKRMINA